MDLQNNHVYYLQNWPFDFFFWNETTQNLLRLLHKHKFLSRSAKSQGDNHDNIIIFISLPHSLFLPRTLLFSKWQEVNAIKETVEEAKPTAIYPHPPLHYPAMIWPLHSALKSHNKKITDQLSKMMPKCAWVQPLDSPTKIRSSIHAICPIISSWTMSSKKLTECANKYTNNNCDKNKNKRGKRALHPSVFGHLLLHWICSPSCQNRLLEAGGLVASPSGHARNEQGYVGIYF